MDGGELNKLISRAAPAGPPPPSCQSIQDDSDVNHPAQYPSREGSYENHPRIRRGSFLSELFDSVDHRSFSDDWLHC